MFSQEFAFDLVAKATVLLAAAALTDFLMRKRCSAAVRHRLWAASFLALILLPVLSVSVPRWELAVLPEHWIGREITDLHPSQRAADADVGSDTRLLNGTIAPNPLQHDLDTHLEAATTNRLWPAPGLPPGNGQPAAASDMQLPAVPTKVAESALNDVISWQSGAVALFVAGFLAALMPLLLGLLRNAWLGRSAMIVEEEEDQTSLRELCLRLAIRRPVKLLEARQTIVPMTWGIFRPVVILPRQWRTWMIESRRLVLLHELAHVKRMDVVYQCVARVACAMFWFHPLAWYALRRLRIERELACDDCVLMAGERPSSYAKQLLNIAREFQSMALPPAVAMAQRSGLEQRIRALLDRARSHVPVSPRVAKTLLLGALVTTSLLAAVRLDAIAGRDETVAAANDSSIEEMSISGRVIGPDGQAVAGARVVALRQFLANTSWKKTYEELATTVSAADGSYSIQVPATSKRFSDGNNFEVQSTHVLASKPGFGPDQAAVGQAGATADLKLAAAEKRLQGKVVDLEGQPLAGVEVRVTQIRVPKGSLAEWTEQAANNPATYSDEMRMAGMGGGDAPKLARFPEDHTIDAMDSLSYPVVHTDRDGTFALSGLGDDREVTLRLDGDAISSMLLTAVTRDMPAVNMPWFGIPMYRTGKTFGAKFVVSGEPAQMIRGRVVDRATGAPVTGAVIRLASYADSAMALDNFLTTRTNQQGEYQLAGVPKAPKNSRGVRIEVIPPRDLPCFSHDMIVPKADGLDPIDVNIQLTRGIWIEGQATDAVTGEPVRGTAAYYPHLANEFAKEHEAFNRSMHTVGYGDGRATDQAGHFRIPALPGSGAVRFVAESPEEYGLEGPSWGAREEGKDPWKLYHIMMPGNAMPKLNIPAGQEVAHVDIKLTPEPAKRFRVVDTAGIPLTGYTVGGQFPTGRPTISGRGQRYWHEPQAASEIAVVIGSDDGKKRPLMFFHEQRELAAVLDSESWRADPNEITTVTLRPCAKLVGRLAFPAGADVAGSLRAGHGAIEEIVYNSISSDGKAMKSPPRKHLPYYFAAKSSFDKDGTFSLTLPASDNISIYYGGGPVETTLLNQISLSPSQVLDLGEIDMSASDVATSLKSKLSSNESASVTRAVSLVAQQAIDVPHGPRQSPTLNFEGRVLDPQGKPLAGAKLYFVVYVAGAHPRDDLKPLAHTDEQGKFQFQVDRSDLKRLAGSEWRFAQLYATKQSFGVAGKAASIFETTGAMLDDAPEAMLAWFDSIEKEQTIRLVADDQPILGRVVTVDGQPVSGARVRVHELCVNPSESLDGWEKAALHPKADYYSLRNEAPNGLNGYQLPSLIPDVQTDQNGRFRLTGLGRERIVELLIEGPEIESTIVKTRTRAGELVAVPHQFPDRARTERYYPRQFSHVAAPSVLVSGQVTDKATGKPIANMSISAGMQATFVMGGKTHIRTMTDADGHYKVGGLALDGTDKLYFVPPAGSKYLPQAIRPALKGRREALTLDLEFNPAPVVTGRAIDVRTGQPIEGAVKFVAHRTNENLANYGQFRNSEMHETRTDQDGNFSIAAVPGEGFITFMALDHAKYKRAADGMKTGTRVNEDTPDVYMTVPTILNAANVHFLKKIDVKPDAPNELLIELSSGQSATGSVLTSTGESAADFLYKGRLSRSGWWPSGDDGRFTVEGYYENQLRDIFFYQPGTNSAAHIRLHGPLPKMLSVQLEPAATIRGRLLDQGGLPLTGLAIKGSDIIDNNSGQPDLQITTDDDGVFEIPGIVPGRSYSAYAIIEGRGLKTVFEDLSVNKAEIKNLGAITIQQ